MVLVKEKIKPQINADEHRFIESGIERIFSGFIYINLINSPQRAQSSQRLFPCSLSAIVNVQSQRLRTRMTRIGRIFTDNVDPCISAPSVKSAFHYNGLPYLLYSYLPVNCVPAFICVHLRLNNRVGGV